MEPIFLLALAGLGAIAGSFLNALLFRYRTGRSALHGRSACMHCKETLRPLDLVPVFSYIFLGGKCRYCKSRLSMQYLLVELAAAGLCVLTYLKFQDPLLWGLSFFVWMVLLFIVVYDLRHGVIPWSASILLALGAAAHAALGGALLPALIAGASLAAPLILISLLSQGRAMGWGDGPLEFGLGVLLGLGAGFSALLVAFVAGACVGILLVTLSRRYTIKSEVPFAPFLVFGAACAFFLNVSIFALIPAFPLYW